jgi:putative membrane protein
VRTWRQVQRWRGLVIIGAMGAVTLWLAATGQLVLYIHPRYIVFTVAMAVIAVVATVLALTTARHHDDETLAPPNRRSRALGLTAAGLAAAFTLGMVLIPPATLGTATAQQRQINATASDDAEKLVAVTTADADTVAAFTVREWSTVLRQTSDLAFFADKPVTALLGFVTADTEDPDNMFYVSRFAVTCCAVDAQPLGVPIYLSGWADEYPADTWVQVSGVFGSNPSRVSSQPVVLLVDTAEVVKQPREPYLF